VQKQPSWPRSAPQKGVPSPASRLPSRNWSWDARQSQNPSFGISRSRPRTNNFWPDSLQVSELVASNVHWHKGEATWGVVSELELRLCKLTDLCIFRGSASSSPPWWYAAGTSVILHLFRRAASFSLSRKLNLGGFA
jgi:hypothetical protein